MILAIFLIALSLCLPVFGADEDEEPELLTMVTGEDFRVILEAEISDLSQYCLSCDPLQVIRHDPVMPSHEAGKLFRALGWATYGVSAADVISTEMFLARGDSELNPLMRNRAIRIGSHIAYPIMINKGTEYVRKKGHPKIALWTRIVAVGILGVVGARNVHVAVGLK